MTATAHALVGGAIAASIPNPAIGLPLAAISHPILDMIPHWDLGVGWRKKNKVTLFTESVLDLIIGIVFAYIFFGRHIDPIYFLACIFFSEIWDLLMMPYLLFGWNFPPFSTAYRWQHKIQSNIKLPWGILTQAVTVYGVVLALRFIH
ncbi:MAG: Uncharacterized protein G01um10147_741 [Microgenomates group bacterium Gr01-1014_7]|nr:MAG: Uncharacterized protein G01um10147_741 [Microgenomates group bacterium Gr01-1014_7]